MKHRWPQFGPFDLPIGQYRLRLCTPRRPMRRLSWMFGINRNFTSPFGIRFLIRLLGVEFQVIRMNHAKRG